ncbi:MAG TPA: PQQ-binding-like beta-propeller repeat protein [Planctomycetota bacterium]|nr:PQQ-binding-like beta-propeller repeat protein [Planctomycetota bacterium]
MKAWQRVVWVGLVAACAAAFAEDWPTYRHDAGRSAVTRERLRFPLSACWTYQPLQAPRPAWGDPNPRTVGGFYGAIEGRRVHFDDVFHAVVEGDTLYFGSSADGKVYALDAATGKERWAFFTGGPVRLPPTVWRRRVYVGSDDGFVYCLAARDGALVWKYLAAPNDRKVLGSGRMVSLWPVRTGVLVDDGVAYFASGVFPAEGVYVHAVGADDGKLLWCNGAGGAQPQSRFSPQGPMLASETMLFVPTGRVSPAAVDRATGKLLQQPAFGHDVGGTFALLADDCVYTGTEQLVGYTQKPTHRRTAWFGGRQLVAARDGYYLATGREMIALDRDTYPQASLKQQGIIVQRDRLNGPLTVSRQRVRRLEASIQDDTEDLAALDRQIAELAKKVAADDKELAVLNEQRAGLAKKLEAGTKALPGTRQAAEKLAEQVVALREKVKAADAELAKCFRWRVPSGCAEIVALAGGALVAGGKGKVVALDAASGETLWTGEVGGTAKGLAIADGRLYVSTDTGAICCFGPAGTKPLGVVRPETKAFPSSDLTPAIEAAADHIVRTAGITRGYCLVLGNDTGRLAYELAKRTELQVHAACFNPDRSPAARKALDEAGLYGSRVVVEQVDPGRLPYSDYFADLIVSEGALTRGMLPADPKEAFRLLRPLGGTILIGQPAEAKGKAKPLEAATLRDWLAKTGAEGGQVTEEGGVWLKLTRGALPGAGSWTHEYAEPGNTTCGDDQLVKCPLGVLWFGDPGPGDMVERHSRAAAPLSINGRFFVQGVNVLMAYNAYNGLKLWRREVPGAMRMGASHEASNLAANADSLFVAIGDKCLRLDAATGETKFTYALPTEPDAKPRTWGYVAVVGDTLYGSRGAARMMCDALFALDLASGKPRWVHEGKSIAHSSISIGDGQVMFVETTVTPEQRQEVLREQLAAAAALKGEERIKAERELKAATVRLVVALDAATGKPIWQKAMDLTGCGGGQYWCALGSMYSKGLLALFGVYSDGHYWKQFFEGRFASRRIVVVDAKSGVEVWSKKIGYRVRPLIVGDTLHAEPWAFDLRTGAQRMQANPLTGQEEPWQWARPGHHCGCPSASPHTLFFRSYCFGYYDLVGDHGTMHFGGQRPGCWINLIPANGLLVAPEASSGCMCPFPTMCTVVFQHRDESRAWGFYSVAGPLTPLKSLGINLGAGGDRRDAAGTLWLGFPRPRGSLVAPFPASVSLLSGGEYFEADPARVKVEGTDRPWVFRSGARGARQVVLPLVQPGDGAARYTVRLAFAELDNVKPGTRVFDVKLQDKLVLAGLDVVKEAGGPNRALVKEFQGIEVKDKLKIEFVPKAKKPTKDELPVLQGIEILREAVLSIGVALPSFVLSDADPEREGEVRLANYKDTEFVGTLRFEPPEGFTVTPAESPVKLATGERATLAVKAAVAKGVPGGKRPVAVKLVRRDGEAEWEGRAEIEHLGPRARLVAKAIEDAHVTKGSAANNYGAAKALLVDGGDAAVGDHDHAIAYLKFRLNVPGKPISAVLRIFNAGNPTGASGNVCLVAAPWKEREITYENRPKPGKTVGKIGAVGEDEVVVVPLTLSLDGLTELSFALDPVNCDGVDYISREGGKPAELVVEYEKAPGEL